MDHPKLLLDHPLPQVERAIARQLALGPVDAGAIRLALDRQRLPATTDLSGYQVPLPDLSQFDRLLTEGVLHA